MEAKESTGYWHVEITHGKSATRGRIEGAYTSIQEANKAAKEIYDNSYGLDDEPMIMTDGSDTDLFFGSVITGTLNFFATFCFIIISARFFFSFLNYS